MERFHLPVAVLVTVGILGSAGCKTTPKAAISIGCQFAIVDKGKVVLSEGTELKLTELENIDHEAVMNVSSPDGEYNYTMLLGADRDAGEKATAYFTSTSPPAVFLKTGWVFLWGRKPQAQTIWVHASAEGTTMVVQIEAAAGVHRVFYLKHTPWHPYEYVTVKCGTTTVALKNEGDYVEWVGGCSTFTTGNLGSSSVAPAITEFIECVQAIAASAGWTE